MLTSNNSKFTSTWKGILEAAGATLCDKLPLKNVQRGMFVYIVIITFYKE